MKIPQSKEDLVAHVSENLGFLRRSVEHFDNGHPSEAKRMAVHIRVLAHDTGKSHSLLGQLGWKSGDDFVDSGYDFEPTGIGAHHPLVGLRASGSDADYFAFCTRQGGEPGIRYVNFDRWWSRVILQSDIGEFTRGGLVRAIADTDGGAHVDPSLDQSYHALAKREGLGWKFASSGDTEGDAIMKAELHTMRQIAFEIIAFLERKLEEIEGSR